MQAFMSALEPFMLAVMSFMPAEVLFMVGILTVLALAAEVYGGHIHELLAVQLPPYWHAGKLLPRCLVQM